MMSGDVSDTGLCLMYCVHDVGDVSDTGLCLIYCVHDIG